MAAAIATTTGAIRDGAATWADSPVTFFGERGELRRSLGDFHAEARSVAAGLARLGIGAGDAVAMQLPNWPEAVVAYLAAFELGAVIVPIVHIYGASEVAFILERSKAKVVVVPDTWRGNDYLARVAPGSQPSTLGSVVVVGDRVPEWAVRWSDLHAPPAPTPDPPAADAPAVLLYTSGTTGQPKGVVHSQRSLLSELRQMVDFQEHTADDVTLVSFPIGHMAGVLSSTRMYLRAGHTVFMESWDAAAAAQLVERHRVTNTAGTPFHMITLFEAADESGRDISSLRTFLLGATSVPPALVVAADARGVKAYRSYGSTEHPTVSCGQPSHSLDDRCNTDGILLPGVEVRIVDDHGDDVPPGREGEILSRGPDRSPGYTDPTLDDAAFAPGGWYRSGDIGVLDERGFLTITDRKKDLIIRGGENIAPKEVEDALLTHPGVRDVAVIGVPDDRYGERVAAVIVATGDPLLLADLRLHVQATGLARQKAPESIAWTDALPRTASGKIQKHVLREWAADRQLVFE